MICCDDQSCLLIFLRSSNSFKLFQSLSHSLANNQQSRFKVINEILKFRFFLFQGWRGIWVSYQESKLVSGRDIDTLKITAPTTTQTTHPLFIDLLRLVSSLSKQTRDAIVPTIGEGIYTPNNFWQQTYRWSLVRSLELMERV